MSSVCLCSFLDRKLIFVSIEALSNVTSILLAILRITKWPESEDAVLEQIFSRTASISVWELCLGRLRCPRPSLPMFSQLLSRQAIRKRIPDARMLSLNIYSLLCKSWSFFVSKAFSVYLVAY